MDFDVSKFFELLGNELKGMKIPEDKIKNLISQCVINNEIEKEENKSEVISDEVVGDALEAANEAKKNKGKSIFEGWESEELINYCVANGFNEGIADFENLNKKGLIKVATKQGDCRIDIAKDYVYSKYNNVELAEFCVKKGYIENNGDLDNLKIGVLRRIAQTRGNYIINADDYKKATPVEVYHNNEKAKEQFNSHIASSESKDIHPINPSEPITTNENVITEVNNDSADLIPAEEIKEVESEKTATVDNNYRNRYGLPRFEPVKKAEQTTVTPFELIQGAMSDDEKFKSKLEHYAEEVSNDKTRKPLDSYDEGYQQQLRNQASLENSIAANKEARKEHKTEVIATGKLKVKNVFQTSKELTGKLILKLQSGACKIKEASKDFEKRVSNAYSAFKNSDYQQYINTSLLNDDDVKNAQVEQSSGYVGVPQPAPAANYENILKAAEQFYEVYDDNQNYGMSMGGAR